MKYVGIAVGGVIIYFAWKVSQDTGAMLIAAGWAIGMASAAIGGLLTILAVRAAQPKRAPRETPNTIDGAFSVVGAPQLGRPQDAPAQFSDAGATHVLGVTHDVYQ